MNKHLPLIAICVAGLSLLGNVILMTIVFACSASASRATLQAGQVAADLAAHRKQIKEDILEAQEVSAKEVAKFTVTHDNEIMQLLKTTIVDATKRSFDRITQSRQMTIDDLNELQADQRASVQTKTLIVGESILIGGGSSTIALSVRKPGAPVLAIEHDGMTFGVMFTDDGPSIVATTTSGPETWP